MTTNNWRDQWEQRDGRAWLDSANQGPFPRVAAEAARKAIELKQFPEDLTNEYYLDLPEQVREQFAKLIGASAAEIAITNGAGDGINYVANGLDWKAGDEVILPWREFPANFFAWVNLAKRGVTVREVEPSDGRFVTADDLLNAMTDKTRLVAASHVGYTTSNLIDLAKVGAECRRRDIPLVVDASQSVGSFPFTVDDLQCDYLSTAGYKWLWCPYGTGFFYARREAQAKLEVRDIRWLNVQGATKFNQLPRDGWELRADAGKWDAVEVSNFTNLSTARASLTLLNEIGPAAVEQHVRRLTDHIVERLPRDAITLCSPEEREHRGVYVNLAARTLERTQEIWKALREKKIYTSVRGDTLRVSPGIYNDDSEIDALLAVLAE